MQYTYITIREMIAETIIRDVYQLTGDINSPEQKVIQHVLTKIISFLRQYRQP